jgi:patatin-like phospholipase/acyl hydrolase
LKHINTLRHVSKYETQPLRKALQKSFGNDPLFGTSDRQTLAHGAKVAVTATDESGQRAIVIANYSREHDSREKRRGHYAFFRPDNPEQELKIWEAAAATSAAPTFFKPFEHVSTRRTYLDGALYHNNPVLLVHRERKLLWPDVADREPDILLSIGTSQNGDDLRESLDTRVSNRTRSR